MRRHLAIAIVVVAALQLTINPSRSTAAPSSNDLCDGTVYYSQSNSKGLLGVTRYHYQIPKGLPFDQVAPPTNFNPVTASDEQLEAANFIPRPTDAKQLKDWLIEASQYKGSLISGGAMCSTSIRPAIPVQSGALAGRGGVRPQASVGHQPLINWSGYRDVGNYTGGHFRKVVGHFTQPNVSANSTSAVGNWIGLDGGSNNYTTLLQAGTVSHETHNEGKPFWEAACGYGKPVCNPAQEPINTYAQPRDDVSMNVNYADGPSSVNVRYQVAINGALIINIEQHYPTYVTSGSSAVFVTEKFPTASLPNFNVIGFSNLRTYPAWNSSDATYWGDQPFLGLILTKDGREAIPPCDPVRNPYLTMYPYPAGNGSTTAFYNRQC